jgi:hypothetical protein
VHETSGSHPGTPAPPPRPRRSFVELREIPTLLLGAALGRDAALRRVLGARKTGRIGSALAAALGLIAAPDRSAMVVGLALYAGLAALSALRHRARGLGVYRTLRLLLWTIPAPLALAAVARLSGIHSRALLPLAVLAGWLLLERGLGAGLDRSISRSLPELPGSPR